MSVLLGAIGGAVVWYIVTVIRERREMAVLDAQMKELLYENMRLGAEARRQYDIMAAEQDRMIAEGQEMRFWYPEMPGEELVIRRMVDETLAPVLGRRTLPERRPYRLLGKGHEA